MKISFVIPAYNEADNICHIIKEIDDSVASIVHPVLQHEIFVVDDCSADKTFEAVTIQQYSHVSIIRLSRRSGSHIALRAGLRMAKGEAVLCLAADGQDDPKVLQKMISKWQQGNEVIWALRHSRDDESFLSRVFASFFYALLIRFSDSNISIDLSKADFYLLDKKVVEAINHCQEKNTSLFGLIIWLGFRQTSIGYDRRKRRSGFSSWSFTSKFTLAKDWIIAFSGIPLRLLTYSGFLIAGTGFLYALYVILSSMIKGNPVQGWSSVMTIILILGGGQAIMLGILGEYLWRTMDESRKRPIYFVEKSSLSKSAKENQ